MVVEVGILVAQADPRSAHQQLAAYADGSGAKSVKQAIEDHVRNGNAVAFDSARVTSVEFEPVTYSSTEFLAATFSVHITGSGA